MSTHKIVPAAVAAAFALITALPADAKPNAKPPKVKPATAKAQTVKPTAAHGPKTVKAKPTTSVKVHGNSTQARAVKPAKSQGGAKSTAASTKPQTKTSVDQAKGSSQKVKGDKSTRTARTDDATGSRPVADTNPRPTELTKAQQLLMKNDNLRAKMAARLPGDIDPVGAANGFKNLGQFVAAVNVSYNQGVDFKAMRQLMLGEGKLSIGQALQQLKGVDIQTANAAADTALTAANRDLAAADVNTTRQKTKRNARG